MSNRQLQTAVALIVFNRPDVTRRVFAQIAAARPPILLVVGDGPRTGHPRDEERVAVTRSIVADVQWDCDVRTNFSDVNLGCRRRLSSGLTWAFEQTPACIVLEDDCLPHPSFFYFCEEMLERYADDKRVFHINGSNFNRGSAPNTDSYYFSGRPYVWGWASWSDRWTLNYDVNMSAWPRVRDSGQLLDLVGGAAEEAEYWKGVFNAVHEEKIDTWDYQWAFACMLNGGSAVTPNANLISNVGFGNDATHTKAEVHSLANLPHAELQFPLRHPAGMFQNRSMDREYFRKYLATSLRRRAINKLRRLAGRS